MEALSRLISHIGIGIPFFVKLDSAIDGSDVRKMPLQELSFLYVQSGSYRFIAENGAETYTVDAGEIFLYLPTYAQYNGFAGAVSAGHGISVGLMAAAADAPDGAIAYFGACSLDNLGTDGNFATLPRCAKVSLEDPERSAIRSLLAYGVSLLSSRPVIRKAVLEGIFQVVVLPRLVAYFADNDGAEPAITLTRGETQIERVVAVMHAKIGHDWNLRKMAGLASMSRSTFVTRFKRTLGCPPLEYLTKLRIEKATAMLKAGAYELGEIAEAIGYGSESAFCRVFKRTTGHSPIACRRAYMAALAEKRAKAHGG